MQPGGICAHVGHREPTPLSCLLVLYTPQAGRMLRAVGRPGSPATPMHAPQGLGESPCRGTRITRVRCSTKPN
jgi:hypothetical protein